MPKKSLCFLGINGGCQLPLKEAGAVAEKMRAALDSVIEKLLHAAEQLWEALSRQGTLAGYIYSGLILFGLIVIVAGIAMLKQSRN